jgi:hypothetical protein
LLTKLLLLVVMLLMPLGMAPSAAAEMHRSMGASSAMQHCPEQSSKHEHKGAAAECTMACSAALPAADTVRAELPLAPGEPLPSVAVRQLHGLHPETATPPPRHA